MEDSVTQSFICDESDGNGRLQHIEFRNAEKFNFAFDIVDVLGMRNPTKLAMIHIDRTLRERKFTFSELSKESNRAANYLISLGIHKGDPVMLVLRRSYQFWIVILALHKIGAIAIPATHQLKTLDYIYRFKKASVKVVIACGEEDIIEQIDEAAKESPSLITKISVNGVSDGWKDFDKEYLTCQCNYHRKADSPCGNDTMLMLFSSGTTGYPKLVVHSYMYPLGHYITAKYWHCIEREGLHLTISDTGWGKALWGKLYGQWLCEGAVFVYDYDRFNADEIIDLIEHYHITTFCAPPTIYRMLMQGRVSLTKFASIHCATTAGEAIGTETLTKIQQLTGMQVKEGYGQTETTLCIATLKGDEYKLGSMGKPIPSYFIDLLDDQGNRVSDFTVGEIAINLQKGRPIGLFKNYCENTKVEDRDNNWYHTGDLAQRDADGYYFYAGRKDDIIKSSGYKIGPNEIENVIMELPYVLECGVSAAPDDVRGQIVKATIVLKNGFEPSNELAKAIQEYVKKRTAPYKYPRAVVFKDFLPKTISGKVIRNLL